MGAQDLEDELIEEVAKYTYDPEGYAQFAFPWGDGELEDSPGLKAWQTKFFRALGQHLQNPKTRYQPFLYAAGSGHGIGKSAAIGILLNWGMSTCEDCRAVITANTDTQLRTKTAPEVGKWFRLSITAHWFETPATAVYAKDPRHEKSWRADFVPWSKNNTEAFAGLHNKRKRIILVFDEASAIDDKVWEVAEGALTDEDTEIIWVVFGNVTRNTGRFRECFRKFRHRWQNIQIDSRTVEGTNKAQIQKWEEDYGEDSDFFKVRVRGLPPALSARQLISTDDADKARGKHLRPEQFNFAAKILTLDNAWEGDDEGVIGIRQGLMFKVLKTFPKNDNDIQIANMLARFEDEEEADAVFIDGGYGTGVVSAGRTWGRNWTLVWFAEKVDKKTGCFNKRAEMWVAVRDWLKAGGSIPDDQALYDDLTGPETVGRLDGLIQLESKKDMKERGLPSPGRGDALALSFAHPVLPRARHGHMDKASSHKSEYDPFDETRG